MKNAFMILTTAALFIATSSFENGKHTANKDNNLPASNPFSSVSTLPFQAPDFTKIKDADYKPAFEEGFKILMTETEKIANNPAPPTFDNTIIAMERSGELMKRVYYTFNMIAGANTDDMIQNLQEEIAPKRAASLDNIYLNTNLFKRVKIIYDQRSTLKLDAESKKLIEFDYQKFILCGANLSDADKETMKKLNEEEASLNAKFINQMVNGVKSGAFETNDAAQLAGLTQNELDALALNAKANNISDKYLVPLQNTTQQPILQSLSDRATRQKIFEASLNRAEKGDSNDTRTLIVRLASIRTQQAKLMGYTNYASWKLQDQMAQTPDAVNTFLAKLVPSVKAKAVLEAADIQTLINTQKGDFTLQPYDWEFYADQVRKAKYNLDQNEIKPYFELNKVLIDGVFYAATQLYGITFKERHDIPVYQKDVRVFEIYEANGKPLALFYCDYFKRDNKSGGAWMGELIPASKLLNEQPVIYNVCNFTKPAPGQPALISFDDVTTMFHEFGHALHGMFASGKYPSLAGTNNVARDYVEFPSQFNENWALYPSVLKHYAVHYKTGAPIPQTLVDKIKKSSSFNEGYEYGELLAAASLDMQWHTITDTNQIKDVDAFEKQALINTGLDMAQVPPRYRSTYFQHIWGGGYAAGYYAYSWTKMLAQDSYAWFEKNGGLTRANGQRFREMILSKGNAEDYNVMFKNFNGHVPDIKPLEKDLELPVK
jgi:peptidyl-dipeptidase Dcp